MAELIALSSAQREAATKALNLASSGRIPLLVGLSGVGKTTALSELRQGVTPEIIDAEEVAEEVEEGALPSPAVITSTPINAQRIQDRFPGKTVPVIMAGLTQDETAGVAQNIPNQGQLQDQDRIDFSLGIPSLVQELSGQLVGEFEAIVRVTNLVEAGVGRPALANPDTTVAPYLRMPIPIQIRNEMLLRATTDMRPTSLDALQSGERRRQELDQPDQFAALEFTAPESPKMYGVFTGAGTRAGTVVDILAHGLTTEQHKIIRRELGLSPGGGELAQQGTRFNLTAANVARKITVIESTTRGAGDVIHGETDKLNKVTRTRDQMLAQTGTMGDGHSVFVHRTGHSGDINDGIGPAAVAVESLLQQIKAPYFVDNKLSGKRYDYDPIQNRILQHE